MLDTLLAHLAQTATTFELAWTFPALFALAFRVWLLGLVAGDVRYWHHTHKIDPARDVEAEMIWSTSQLWHKIVLASILLLMAGFGMVAMWSPPVVKPPPPPTRVTYMLTLVFILIPTLMAMDAVQTLVNRIRNKAADDLRQAHQGRRSTDVNPLPGMIMDKIDAAEQETEQ
jgi:hypothetical protein